MRLNVTNVVAELLDLEQGHAPLDAPLDRARLVVREIVPELLADENEELRELLLGLILTDRSRGASVRVSHET